MSEFDWMIGAKIIRVSVDEAQNWYFSFEGSGTIGVWCPWRIIVKNRIAVSNDDHEQRFGLPEQINSAQKAMELLSSLVVTEVHLSEGTLDLILTFQDRTQLELIPFSSGYESWHVTEPSGKEVVAQGGGKLSYLKA